MKQHRLGRVEVFRLPRIDDAPAEGDHAATGIADGKHDAVTEAVVVTLAVAQLAALTLDDQAGVDEALAVGVGGAEAPQHLVPRVRRVAKTEARDGFGCQSTLREVIAGARIARQALRVEARDPCHQFEQRLIGAPRAAVDAALVRDFQAQSRGELLDGLRKRQVIVIHEEAEHRTVLAAAEAVIELLVGAHPEGGGLLVVERAAGLVLATGLLQLHACADHLHDVGAGDQLVDEVLGDASQTYGRATRKISPVSA